MNYSTYPIYKSSGINWLGNVPEHWEIKKLKYVIRKVIGGGTPTTSEKAFWNGDIPWVSPKDMKVEFISDSEDHITELALAYSPATLVPIDSVLIVVRSGILKHTFPVAINTVEVTLNQDMKAIQPDRQLNSQFLKWLLQGQQGIILAYCSKLGATVDSIETESIFNFNFAYPPIQEQLFINEYLSIKTAQLDKLIAQKQDLIALLVKERAGIINEAVTKGLNSRVAMRDSGIAWLGNVPEHWEVKKLKYLTKVRTGIALGGQQNNADKVSVPYLRVANVQDGYLNLDTVYTIDVSPDLVERYSLQYGDLLMNEGGDNDKLGRGCVWLGEIDKCIHQNHVFAVRPSIGVDSNWINAVTLTYYARHYFITRCKQSTNLASISSTNIKEFPVIFPPVFEQEEILTYINIETSRIDEAVLKINQEIELLTKYRSALISEVVTGKIKVIES